ncbi:MAG TPA: hypothetical protein VIL81_02505, partial [Candidatus Limnocylindrales bacterium]
MSTSDGRASVLAFDPVLDASLTALFAVDIPVPVLDRLDDRIRHGLRTWSPRPGRLARFRPG